MVDVSHPGDLLVHAAGSRSTSANMTSQDTAQGGDEDEEAAWLRSVQEAGADSVTNVDSLKAGNLILDMSQLRAQPQVSTPRKSTKGKLPA